MNTLFHGSANHVVRTPATDTAAEVDWSSGPVVVLAVKSHQTEAALADLADHAPPETPVVSAQNGVANEPAVLRRFAATYGILYLILQLEDYALLAGAILGFVALAICHVRDAARRLVRRRRECAEGVRQARSYSLLPAPLVSDPSGLAPCRKAAKRMPK